MPNKAPEPTPTSVAIQLTHGSRQSLPWLIADVSRCEVFADERQSSRTRNPE
jgi:hypothetical protein